MDLGKLLRRDNVRLIAVATAFAVIGLSAPAVSQDVRTQLGINADKVDGKDAVGYSAPASKRKGKLVATHPRTGQLPSGVMAKAPDASKLAGLPSSSYTARKAKSGQVQTGVYAVTGETVGGLMATGIEFNSALLTQPCPQPDVLHPPGQLHRRLPRPRKGGPSRPVVCLRGGRLQQDRTASKGSEYRFKWGLADRLPRVDAGDGRRCLQLRNLGGEGAVTVRMRRHG